MQESRQPSGSATRWGPLFGGRARDWAETWEGPEGWGIPVYEHILDRLRIGAGSRVLDCGCGAGRFARMAVDRGASVAGVDAAEGLLEIAAERTPEGDFRVGDLEQLPWPEDAFDVVTGFSAFQFADDKVRALAEARRVSRGPVAVVIPSRVSESGIAAVFKPLFPLFPPEALEGMKNSGMFALSEPGKLEEVLAGAGLTVHEDDEIESLIVFDDAAGAVRAFVGAGPTALAIGHSGEPAVGQAVREALGPFTGTDGTGGTPHLVSGGDRQGLIFEWRHSVPIHQSAWKWNSRKVASSILHMRRYRDTFWSSEPWMRREGDHNIPWAWIHIHGYECDFRRPRIRAFWLRWCTCWCSKSRKEFRLLSGASRLCCKWATLEAEEEGFEPSIPR